MRARLKDSKNGASESKSMVTGREGECVGQNERARDDKVSGLSSSAGRDCGDAAVVNVEHAW